MRGMPCVHGVAAILHQARIPSDYVDEWYTKEKYLQAYQNSIKPLNGSDLWPVSNKAPLVPPIVTTQPGRKKKARNKSQDEKEQSTTKLGRKMVEMTCSKCGNSGHNKRSCKGQGARPGGESSSRGGASRGGATRGGFTARRGNSSARRGGVTANVSAAQNYKFLTAQLSNFDKILRANISFLYSSYAG